MIQIIHLHMEFYLWKLCLLNMPLGLTAILLWKKLERDKVLPVPIHQGSSGEEDSALKCSAFGLEVCYGSSSGQAERSW